MEPGQETLREQPMWHIEHVDRAYEFTNVYEREVAVLPDGTSVDRRLDGRCFWTILRLDVDPADPNMHVESETISYDEYRDAFGKDAVSFAQFASPLVDPTLIEDWVRNRDRHVLRRRRGAAGDEEARDALTASSPIGHWAMRFPDDE